MRAYFKLKACPRCGGDILVDRAVEDAEICIQCGFRKFEMAEYPAHLRDLEKTAEIKINGRANSKVVKNS